MKATLEFQLPDEREEHIRAVQAEYFKEQEQRENAMLRRALADALSTFQHEDEVIVTAERLEAWKAALTNGGKL